LEDEERKERRTLEGLKEQEVTLKFFQGKKDLNHVKCFKCHKNDHYASQCFEERGKGKQQQ